MSKCNACGKTEGLRKFNIDGCFGYNADHFDSMHFSFELCHVHFVEFYRKGENQPYTYGEDDYTWQYGKAFRSHQIKQLLDTFKYVPEGYYNDNWTIYTNEEEQWMWENPDKDLFDHVTYERLLDFEGLLNGVDEAIKRRFPDKDNPYITNIDNNNEYISDFELLAYALQRLGISREELKQEYLNIK